MPAQRALSSPQGSGISGWSRTAWVSHFPLVLLVVATRSRGNSAFSDRRAWWLRAKDCTPLSTGQAGSASVQGARGLRLLSVLWRASRVRQSAAITTLHVARSSKVRESHPTRDSGDSAGPTPRSFEGSAPNGPGGSSYYERVRLVRGWLRGRGVVAARFPSREGVEVQILASAPLAEAGARQLLAGPA